MGAVFAASEIPLLLMLFYLFRGAETGHCPCFWPKGTHRWVDLGGRHCQVGSLAGVAHLLKDNAGVLR